MRKTELTDFHKRLQRWYQTHGRAHLPWRNTQDPYAIYLSEIMLQQTQVTTVLERYYFPFLKRFPTLAHLAKAPQQDVLHAWQGLGYYNRAINLHRTAQACAKTLPDSVDALMALPGIGRNTAHAVAAFAFRKPVAVMEANVKRVLCRIFALKQPTPDELWEKAALLLDEKNPFDYNQAMMDIGSLVCTKRSPRCTECPAGAICAGRDAPESYPAKTQKKAPPVRQQHILVKRNARGEYYATPRTGKFLSGLYHFTQSDAPEGTPLGHVRQQYSHFTLEADIWLVKTNGTGKHWHSFKALHALPMSMAEKKILQLLAAADSEAA